MCCFLSLALFVILHSLHFWKSKLERCFYQSEWAIRPIERVLFLVSFSQGKNRKGKKKKNLFEWPWFDADFSTSCFHRRKSSALLQQSWPDLLFSWTKETSHWLQDARIFLNIRTVFFRSTFYKRKKKEKKNLKTSA